MPGFPVRSLALVLVLAVSGCAGSRKVVPADQQKPAGETFLIGPEDVLEISVWQNEDLTRTVTVRPDGMISMPLVGDIQAANLTPEELKVEIRRRLTPFVEDPIVAVIVQQINSWRIYIQGEVRSPGVYPIRSHVTIAQAITLAGGFTEFAKRSKIELVRRNGTSVEIMKINYNHIVEGRDAAENVTLNPGDTIIVP